MALFFEQRQDLQVYHLSQQLAEAVELILNPNSPLDKRVTATRVCEEFKDNKTYLTSCGIYLYSSHSNFSVKHYGLQLIQHAVRFHWNNMSPEEKNNLKFLSLDFIQGCTGALLEEPSYIKDGIAKFTVEIMKREWPQQWPDAIEKLSKISQRGHSQLFTVLRTLLCLAEEATKIDGDLPTTRRKEMMTSLNAILEDLFKFFVNTLRLTAEKMKELKTLNGDDVKHNEVLIQKALGESVLTTLCGYVEWVNVKFLVQENVILLQTLCLLLKEDDLRLKAAECLEAIAGRKGPTLDRQPLLILLSMDAINLIFSSVMSICSSDNIFESNDEERHAFVKRVVNILTLLGHHQLAVLWGTGCDIDEPTHFHVYLEALIFLHKQNNMLTSDIINKTWASFLRNSLISKNPTFCSYIPQILEIAKTKISRAQHPIINSNPALYPDMDFGSMGEKLSAWTTLRASTKDIVQEITTLYPTDAFLHAATWLLKLTNTPSTTSQVTETSAEYLEWESLTSFATSVLNKLFNQEPTYIKELVACQTKVEDTTITVCELAKKCIEALVEYETEALMIMNQIMLCFEPFIPFLQFYDKLLLRVMNKIFSACSYDSQGETDARQYKDYEYRRTAASIWIRLCLAHSRLLINIIDDLTKHICTSFDHENRTGSERSLLVEGLVVISNGYLNFEKQSNYLNELLAPTKKTWMSPEMELALSSPHLFISFIGLDNAEEDAQVQPNRSTLNMCLRFIHAVMKRTEPPKNTQEQINGGFKTRLEDEPLNPAAPAILPLLSNMFHVNRVLSSIWLPSVRARIPPCYQAALSMHESEKAAIFAIDSRSEPQEKLKDDKGKKSKVELMKTFLFKLSETCAMILSDCSRLGEGYYKVPLLGQHLVNYVIEPWRHLPNYRLRNYIRNFLKMFCRVCPSAYHESAVIPVVVAAFPLMVEHLNKEWEVVRSREIVRPHLADVEENEIENGEKDQDNQEVIENQLVHFLTKNLLETFFSMCTTKRPSFNAPKVPTEETAVKSENSDDILEELPKFLLKHPESCTVVLFMPFIALQWPDSASFAKAAKLCVPFIKHIVQNPPTGVAMAPEMFEQIFTMCLKGLQLMGHAVEIQSQLIRNAVVIYDILRPLFPSLKNIILQVPDVDAAVLNNYDLALLSGEEQTEKQKKKIFKGLLTGLIGKEIGKMFQHDITILNLPALPVVKKESTSSLLDSDDKDLGLIRLFEPAATT